MIETIEFENIRKLAMSASYNNSQLNNKIICKDINIICGRNGSGKSTILDMIRGLVDKDVLDSLPRENMDNYSTSRLKFIIDKKELSFEFKSINIRKHKEIKNIRSGKTPNVNYYNNIDPISIDNFVRIINESEFLHDKLLGVYKNPLKEGVFSYIPNSDDDTRNVKIPLEASRAEGYIEIPVNDDAMHNSIKFDYVPSGWKKIANIIYFLKEQDKGSVCLIDEPEVHLHPELQRILIEQIIRIQKEKQLQIFIATHSTIFIDPLIWDQPDSVSLLFSDGYGVVDNIKPAILLADMGIKSSDLFQSVGIIWVEGPSDKIYIKNWLDSYSDKYGNRSFIENIHYSFVLYGGALMKHYSQSSDAISEERIDIERINRNLLFIFDKDNGCETYKEHIKKSKLNYLETSKYTIEGYLPEHFFCENFTIDADGVIKINSSTSKVEVAKKFIKSGYDFDKMMEDDDFKSFIEHIYTSISNWNS